MSLIEQEINKRNGTHHNLIIGAAEPLFVFINRLYGIDTTFERGDLLKYLIAEVRSFEDKIYHSYSANAVIMARSILCAFIDEVIAKSSWGVANKWEANTLTEVFAAEGECKDFMAILTEIMREPLVHLDLLEFLSLCVHLGLEVKNQDDKKNNLANIDTVDDLHRLLQKYRPQTLENLLVQPEVATTEFIITTQRVSKKFWRGFAIGLLLAVVGMSALYLTLNAKLQQAAAAVYKSVEGKL